MDLTIHSDPLSRPSAQPIWIRNGNLLLFTYFQRADTHRPGVKGPVEPEEKKNKVKMLSFFCTNAINFKFREPQKEIWISILENLICMLMIHFCNDSTKL